MTIGEKALALAIQDADAGVREIPDGSNTGPDVLAYQRATWLSGTRWPWCAAAANYWWREAGYTFPDRSAGAWDLVDRAVRNGWGVEVPVARALPGDLVAFRFGSGHIALFERHDAKKQVVHTVDGNVSNRVQRTVRSTSTIYRVVHPLAQPGPLPLPVKPPLYEVVTSASGTRQVVFSGRRLQAAKYVSDNLASLLKKGVKVIVRPKP